MDKSIFNYDSNKPLAVQQAGPPDTRNGVTIHDVTYASPDGGRVAAYLIEPPHSANPPHAGIVWAHWLETEAKNANRTQFVAEAVELAQAGVVSVLPDLAWATTPAQWAQHPEFFWRTNCAYDVEISAKQVKDLRRAIDLLYTRTDIDQGRIAFVGHDFGAMYGALVAAVDHRAQFYALLAGTYSFGEWFVFGAKTKRA